MKPRMIRAFVWHIEDDQRVRDRIKALFARDLSDCHLTSFASLAEALAHPHSPHLVILDLGAIGEGIGAVGTEMRHFTRLVRQFMDKHKSAVVAVYCGVHIWARDLIEDVKSVSPETVLVELPSMKNEDVIALVKKYGRHP